MAESSLRAPTDNYSFPKEAGRKKEPRTVVKQNRALRATFYSLADRSVSYAPRRLRLGRERVQAPRPCLHGTSGKRFYWLNRRNTCQSARHSRNYGDRRSRTLLLKQILSSPASPSSASVSPRPPAENRKTRDEAARVPLDPRSRTARSRWEIRASTFFPIFHYCSTLKFTVHYPLFRAFCAIGTMEFHSIRSLPVSPCSARVDSYLKTVTSAVRRSFHLPSRF